MKGLIKNHEWLELGDVKEVNWGESKRLPINTPARQPATDPATERLQVEIESLRSALATAEARHVKDIEARTQQARQEAAEAHRKNDRDALLALSNGITSAKQAAEATLGDAEHLALMIATAALERVFADAGEQTALLTRAIHRQTSHLQAELVTSVRVSAADFPVPQNLEELQKTLGDGISIRHDAKLSPGACRIDLRLGHIDLSLPDHWDALKAELLRLAEDRRPA